MKRFVVVVLFVVVWAFTASVFAGDPVPLPCHPNCGPVDPCKIAPERCKDKGGPIIKNSEFQSGQLTPPDLKPTLEVHPSPEPVKPAEPLNLTPKKLITLIGTLKKSMAVGGEGSGWTLSYADKTGPNAIDVDFEPNLMSKAHDGTTMTVTGEIVMRQYIGRGNVRTLLVGNIDSCTNKYNYCIESCARQEETCVSNGNDSSYCAANYTSCSIGCENRMYECWKE